MSEGHGSSKSALIKVFVALVILTIVTVLAAQVELGTTGNIVLGLAIASCKALLVALIFMHLKWDLPAERWFWFPTIFPVALFVFMVIMCTPDVGLNKAETADEIVRQSTTVWDVDAKTGHSYVPANLEEEEAAEGDETPSDH
jgi:cytochrome c oxidase subunit 4